MSYTKYFRHDLQEVSKVTDGRIDSYYSYAGHTVIKDDTDWLAQLRNDNDFTEIEEEEFNYFKELIMENFRL